MPVRGLGMRTHRYRGLVAQAKLCSHSGAGYLLVGFHAAAPGDQRATLAQQRSGVLGHDWQWRESSGCDDVTAADPLAPALHPLGDDYRVGRSCRLGRPGDEGALAAIALDQEHRRVRASDREWEAGHAGTGAEIRDRPRLTDLRDFERDERVGKMVTEGLTGSADRRWGEPILSQQRQKGGKAGSELDRKTESCDEGRKSEISSAVAWFHVKPLDVSRSGGRSPQPGSIDEGGHDKPARGLLALAVGLDVMARLEMLVNDLALECVHRLQRHCAAVADRGFGGLVGL